MMIGLEFRRRTNISGPISGRFILLAAMASAGIMPYDSCTAADEPARMVRLQVAARDRAAAQRLVEQIAGLSPRVRAEEAAQLAECIYNASRQLRRDYQVVWPPLFNNFLVNSGMRKRGLCFQWAEDLLSRLDALKLRSMELHWGEAHAGTSHENNCIIITAAGQPFSSGILIDCWRHSGRVYWNTVGADRFPWIENQAYARFVRAKSAAAAGVSAGAQSSVHRQTRTNGALAKISASAH